MDLPLALWRIAPAAAYRLTDDRTAIAEWRGPGAQPTPAQLQAAWDAYQAEQADAAQAQQAAAAERTAASGDLQTQYQTALARLDGIIATGGTYTAAQVRDAVVDLTRIVRRTLRLLKAQAG